MTLLAIESFDTFGDTNGDAGSSDVVAGMEAKYTGQYDYNSSEIRVYDGWGETGKGLSFGKDGYALQNYALIPTGVKTEVIVGFAYKLRQPPSAAENLVSFYDISDDSDQIHLRIFYNNTIQVRRGSGGIVYALGYAYDVLRPGRWYYIEVRAVIDNASGEVEIKVNGKQVLNLSGIDTQIGATSQLTHIKLWGAQGHGGDVIEQNQMFDDLYIVDTSGADNNTFLGPGKAEALYPDAEGDNIQWTPSTGTDNSANVDENPRNDDTDYNESGVTGNYDLLTAGNLATITGNVKGVQLNTDARVTNATPIDLINKIKSSTTEDEAVAQAVSDSSNYTTFYDVWEQDPATSTAWTVSGVNGIQIGYEVG